MFSNVSMPILILLPMICAFIGYGIGRKSEKVRDILVLSCTVAELLIMLFSFGNSLTGEVYTFEFQSFMNLGLSLQVDGFRFLYCVVAMLMWLMCTLFSKQYFAHYQNRNRYYFFWLFTLSATVGVFLSGDLITAFVFFEIMSFTSYVFVAQDESESALRAAGTYLAVAVIGGLVMLMGLFLLQDTVHTLQIDSLRVACEVWLRTAKESGEGAGKLYLAGGLILFGFGAKAGMFPLHIWLPKAHPVAPAPASAILSGMLTKVGIFGILVVCCRMFFGNAVLGGIMTGIGLITMLLGAVLALFSVDLKRTLACSSVSQIGFILTGIGMQGILAEENVLASAGTFLHMVNHSLFKLVLFLVAGVVVQNLHSLNLNKIRGFGRRKPFLMAAFLSAALGIGGIPLFSGYISKTLLHESILEGMELYNESAGAAAALKCSEIIFLLSGGITVAYMLKLFIAVFVEKNQGREDAMRNSDGGYLNLAGRIAIGLPALLLPLFGILPNVFYRRFAGAAADFMNAEELPEGISYFSLVNLKGAGISIVVGVLLYFLVVRTVLMKKTEQGREYVNRWPDWLDLENLLYRPLLLRILPNVFGFLCRLVGEIIPQTVYRVLMNGLAVLARVCDYGLDSLLLLFRKTTYRELPTEKLYIGTRMTYRFGRIANFGVRVLNRTVRRNHPVKKDYVVVFAELYELNKRRNRMLESSLSFGLLMFCVGMCATMIYLLLH